MPMRLRACAPPPGSHRWLTTCPRRIALSPHVSKLRGAILWAKRMCICCWPIPHNPSIPSSGARRTRGISSARRAGPAGGAAAALAAGMTPFDIGTDLTGSIRIPAHFCGVFGLKPTEHRVPLTGLIPGLPGPRPIRIMSCIGPMARTVEDMALLFAIIAGPDGRDTEVAPVPVEEMPQLELNRLRIAFAPTFPGFPVAAEMRAEVEELAKQLTPLCAADEAATLPQVDFNQELASAGALIRMMTGAFQPEEQERPTTLAHYLEALHRRDQSILAWEQFFDEWDVLLCPPSMVTAFPHCETGTPLY